MQSSHHKISFLEFSKFSEKLQIYVNTLALQTIISISNNPPGQEVMQKLFQFLFDIFTAKMQSAHHKISFLEFSKFSEKLQIYVNTLALQTIISISNNPPGQEVTQKLFQFLFDIFTAKMQSANHKISFLEFSKFSEKLQIYVNTEALRTIISSLNNPPGQEII